MNNNEIDLNIPLFKYQGDPGMMFYSYDHNEYVEILSVLDQVNAIVDQTEYFTNNKAVLFFPGVVCYQDKAEGKDVYEYYFFKTNKIAIDAEIYAVYAKIWIDFDDNNKIEFEQVRCMKINGENEDRPKLYDQVTKTFNKNTHAVINKTDYIKFYDFRFQVLEGKNSNDVSETYFILNIGDEYGNGGCNVFKEKLNI